METGASSSFQLRNWRDSEVEVAAAGLDSGERSTEAERFLFQIEQQ